MKKKYIAKFKIYNGFATDEDKDKLIKLLMKSNNGKS